MQELPVSLLDTVKQHTGFGTKYIPPARYSVVVAPSPGAGIGPTYRSFDFRDALVERFDPNIRTVWDLFTATVAKYPQAPFHGTRVKCANDEAGPYTFTTYAHCLEQVMQFGSGLSNLALLRPDVENKMQLLGIMGRNAPEWAIAELACLGWGGTTVPLYDSLKGEALSGVLALNGCATVVCDAPSASALLSVAKHAPGLTTLVVYGPGAEQVSSSALKVLSFDSVLAAGRASPCDPSPPMPSTVFSFVYTSGSTGTPKGALISHAAAIANVTQILVYDRKIGGLYDWVEKGEFHMSFLPMAHAMERTVQQLVVAAGGCIGFSQGIRDKILDDIKALRPTFFPAVPRLLNRIHDKIWSTVEEAGGIKKALFTHAFQAKLEELKHGYIAHPIWDLLVFGPMKAKLGFDRLRKIITGSAPVAGSVLDFFRAAFGVLVAEGYGASETVCVATGTHPHAFTSEHVGAPAPAQEIRLIDVPSMQYSVLDTKHGNLDIAGRGEVCVRGKALMSGYYRVPSELNNAVIDADGFYHTGDVGVWLTNGTLKIVDRVRNIFKLSNGEYVAVEKVENILCRCPLIAQAFVHGDSFHPRLVAIIVPDVDTALPWAKANGVEAPTMAALCDNAQFKKAVSDEMQKVGRANGLLGYEVPVDFWLEPVPFGPENILTPTFKIQRAVAKMFYSDKLEALLGRPE